MFTPKEGELVVEGKSHTWAYCDQCKTWVVICGKCGNNCCNGGSGRSIKGVDCDCMEAYDIQDLWFDSPEYEEWVKSEDYKTRETEAGIRMEKYWKEMFNTK